MGTEGGASYILFLRLAENCFLLSFSPVILSEAKNPDTPTLCLQILHFAQNDKMIRLMEFSDRLPRITRFPTAENIYLTACATQTAKAMSAARTMQISMNASRQYQNMTIVRQKLFHHERPNNWR